MEVNEYKPTTTKGQIKNWQGNKESCGDGEAFCREITLGRGKARVFLNLRFTIKLQKAITVRIWVWVQMKDCGSPRESLLWRKLMAAFQLARLSLPLPFYGDRDVENLLPDPKKQDSVNCIL